MKEFNYVIKDEVGIHARPAGELKKEAKKFTSVISVVKGDKAVPVTKTLALMGLGVKCGDEIKVTVEGEDEDTAVAKIQKFFEDNF